MRNFGSWLRALGRRFEALLAQNRPDFGQIWSDLSWSAQLAAKSDQIWAKSGQFWLILAQIESKSVNFSQIWLKSGQIWAGQPSWWPAEPAGSPAQLSWSQLELLGAGSSAKLGPQLREGPVSQI